MLRVLIKLLERGIPAIPAPDSWSCDIAVRYGLLVEVKASNGRKIGKNYKYFFNLTKKEYKNAHFIILEVNTHRKAKDRFLYYIIPKNELKSLHIGFRPFSRGRKSKFLQFQGRWDLILARYKELESLAIQYGHDGFCCV